MTRGKPIRNDDWESRLNGLADHPSFIRRLWNRLRYKREWVLPRDIVAEKLVDDFEALKEKLGQ